MDKKIVMKRLDEQKNAKNISCNIPVSRIQKLLSEDHIGKCTLTYNASLARY